jgi:hypothetical protein
MDKNKLIAELKQIESTSIIDNNNLLEITNQLNGYTAKINCEDVIFTQNIKSPMGDECLQIFYSDGGGIIVTPDDFVFDVVQDGLVNVSDLPPMCSIREMMYGFEKYLQNPNPSENIDNNMGLFYLHYYIMKSAIAKGFQLPMFKELSEIGLENGFLFE